VIVIYLSAFSIRGKLKKGSVQSGLGKALESDRLHFGEEGQWMYVFCDFSSSRRIR